MDETDKKPESPIRGDPRANRGEAAVSGRERRAKAVGSRPEPNGIARPRQTQRLFEARAAEAARPVQDASRPTASEQLVVFTLGNARFGVEGRYVSEIISLRGITWLPSLPPVYRGVINHRGHVVPVLDLRALIGTEGDSGPVGKAILIAANGSLVAIAAHSLEGTAPYQPQHLTRLETQCLDGSRGVTPDLVTVLDPSTLLADRRVVVNDDPV